MDQFREWQDEEENISIKCPIHNCVISPKPNQPTYRINQMITPNYSQPQLEIFHSPNQLREEMINNEYNNYNINNLSPNQKMQNNYYNYPEYSYQNKQQYNYSNQYYNIRNNNENNSSSNLSTNESSSLRRYESSDGVLRGYTNNYSFYVSGSSQNKPKITINNQYSNNNYNQNRNLNQRKYINKNMPSPQRVGVGGVQFQRVNFPNNNNILKRQINQNENSYIIRVVENEPYIYNQTNQRPIMNNYNNNNWDDDVYYYENENNDETQNIPPQRNYRGPIIQRRMVKRVVDKEPMDRKGFYINEPMDNRRNMYKNKINIEQNKPFYQKINNYSNNNINLKNFNSNNISRINETHNNINRTDYFISYPPRRLNTPNIPKSHISPNTKNYPRPIQYRQQKIIGLNQNYQKNSNNNISYQSTSYLPYRAYIEQNDYIYTRTEGNSPRNKSPYLKYSPNININNNSFNENRYTNFMRPRQREYTSRTEFQNQREYENENDEDDDVYEVPEQFNNNIRSNREYYEERRQNIPSERPFMRINNYSQTQRNGKKYGMYTQTLAMNTNYNNNEYEVDRRDIRNNNRMRENRGNYSVPKIMRPISDVQRLVRQNREYSAFERSLRNIRDNEEEIELDNEERNNRVRIKTSGSNNHRLFISDNNRGRPSRKYKTFTELQENRAEGYILQDVDDNSDEFDIYQNIKNRNMVKYNNLRIIKNENKYRPPPPKYEPEENNYYEEENIEHIKNIQKINNRNKEDELNEENDNNDEEEQIYDSKQLINTKEDNFRIVHNSKMVKRREEFNEEENQDQNDAHRQDIDENEIEGQEEIIHQTNINTEEDLYQRGEEIPQDNDEITPMNKNIKNIQTEINEKYYDNQGNYLGEKKIITTKQVPVINKIQREELEEAEYFEEQEEQEDNENENDNENEYTPYQSNNKKFKKRGEKNINDKNHKESKYHSYFGDSNNNVYYEIKGSGDINKEEESKNEEEIENRNYKEPIVLVKNVTFGIQSENLCVPAEDNDNEEKENIDEKDNNDEKEADEQQIDENAEIEEEDVQNHINKSIENNDNDKNNNSIVNEQQKIINQNIDEDNNSNMKIKEKESEKDNEQNNNNNEYDNKQTNESKDYNIISSTNGNINEENNIKEYKQEDKILNDEVSNNGININDINEDNNTNKENNENIEDNNININNNETNNENISDKKNIETIGENLEDKNNDEINNETNKENDKIGNENLNENLNIENNSENNYENNIEKINENINENINDYSNNNNELNQNINKESIENINEIIKNENNEENNNENINEENMYKQNNENIDEENMYEQNNENIDEENMYEQNNENINENNYEYNDEEEQFVDENEAEEIENQNIQKDEDREIDVDEGLVDIEDNNNYNYEENQIIIGEEGEIEGEGEPEEEKGGEYNIIEEQNTHKEGNEENEQEN